MAIVTGGKTIECRTWKTDYRGDLLICSTRQKYHGTIPGQALGVVTLADVVPFTKKHLAPAIMTPAEYRPGLYAWVLEYPRLIIPQPVKGKLSLWDYTGPLEFIPEEEYLLEEGQEDIPGEPVPWIEKYWRPLMV